jgi:sugar phosphate permease
MKFTIIKLLLVLGIALATFISLLYPAALTMPYKLLLAAGVLISVKELLFSYVDLKVVYKKARETATGAGMLCIAASIMFLAVLNFLN